VKRSRGQIVLAAVAAIILVLLIRSGIERRREASREGESVGSHRAASRVSQKDGMSIITIDRATGAMSGIAVAPLAPGVHQEERGVYGRVLGPQALILLRDGHASAGEEAEKARLDLNASRKVYEQTKKLRDERGHTGDRDLAAAEKRWRADEARARAIDERLKEVEREARAQLGDGLVSWLCENPRRLDRLIERKDLLIQVAIPAGGTSSPPQGPARIKTLNDTVISAEPISTAPLINPGEGTRSYFYVAPAGSTGASPGAMLPVRLPSGPEARGVIIPESAVVWYEGRAWVYVQKDSEHFSRREIRVETPVPGGWFVKDGFAPGEIVVVNGAQLLLSDEFLSQYQLIEIAE